MPRSTTAIDNNNVLSDRGVRVAWEHRGDAWRECAEAEGLSWFPGRTAAPGGRHARGHRDRGQAAAAGDRPPEARRARSARCYSGQLGWASRGSGDVTGPAGPSRASTPIRARRSRLRPRELGGSVKLGGRLNYVRVTGPSTERPGRAKRLTARLSEHTSTNRHAMLSGASQQATERAPTSGTSQMRARAGSLDSTLTPRRWEPVPGKPQRR
jgi:hypothetical protein